VKYRYKIVIIDVVKPFLYNFQSMDIILLLLLFSFRDFKRGKTIEYSPLGLPDHYIPKYRRRYIISIRIARTFTDERTTQYTLYRMSVCTYIILCYIFIDGRGTCRSFPCRACVDYYYYYYCCCFCCTWVGFFSPSFYYYIHIIFYIPARRELKYTFMIAAAAVVHRREETETATSRLSI